MKTRADHIRRVCAALMLLAAAGVLSAAEGDEAPAADGQGSWSDYGIIMQRNIFSRNRGRRTERAARDDSREAPAPVVLSSESYMVLKGIVAAGTRFAAFIEDTRTSEVYRIESGEAIAGGSVKTATLDSIVFEKDDKESAIGIGQTLSGASAQTVLTFDNLMQWSAGASGTAGSSGAAAESTSEEEAEILRKLLERRKQELGE